MSSRTKPSQPFSQAPNRVLAIGFHGDEQQTLQQNLNELAYSAEFVGDIKHAQKTIESLSPSDFCCYLIAEHCFSDEHFQAFQNLRKQPIYQHIPVVLQLQSNQPEIIQKGLAIEVFFYLIAPYSLGLLKSVLNAANHGFNHYQQISPKIRQFAASQPLLQYAEFTVQTVEQAHDLASVLSYMTPDPKKSTIGLFELILNAIEHGNLEIGYLNKTKFISEGRLKEEINQRLLDDKYRERKVSIILSRTADSLVFIIKDDGSGFDAEPYLDFNQMRAMDNHGRGIMIANQFSFYELHYSDNGSCVTAVIYLNR